jgi:hypothetical protein
VKSKVFNLLLILTSLVGYLEWGKDNKSFLFQAEAEIISKLFTDPASVIHPFTMLPLTGQLILLITVFQKRPNKVLTFIGMAGIGVLLTFMFVIGLMSLNYYIVLSTIPFLLIGFLTIRHHRRMAQTVSP